jgi:two-component system cell cycle sensor histidine kinase/response regulator CckA
VAESAEDNRFGVRPEDFRILFEQASVGIFIATAEGKYVDVNPSGHALLGYGPGELVGRNVADILPPAEHARLVEALSQAARGELLASEWTFLRRDGTSAHAHVTVQRLGSGLLMAIVRDLTAQKDAERRASESEAPFRALLDRMEDFVVIVNGEGRLTHLNRTAVRILGRPADELLGKLPWEAAPGSPDPAGGTFRAALAAVLSGTPRVTSTSFVPWLERWFDFDLYAFPPGAFVIARDVTAARQANDELTRSEERFRAMVESSPEAIFIMDSSTGKFRDVNSEAERLFGRTRAELLTLGPLDLMAPAELADPSFAARFGRELEKVSRGEEIQVEWQAIGARGQPITIEVHGRRLPSTEPMLLRASIFDVTARKQAQEHLAKVQRLEAVARLAGGVAHDFNNMLTVIMGDTELAMAALPATHPARADLENVLGAARRSSLITRQLLAFGRRQEAAPRVVDLTQYTERMQPVLQRLVGEDVEILLDLARPLGGALIDPAHVEQILINLAANARDAMPGGGTITIHTANVFLDGEYQRLHNGVPPGRYVLLSVADTGEGVPEAIKPHIFEPFFTTKTSDRGTGLGLATVHGIVKRNGGHIWLYSEAGLGATFKIYLPIVDEPASADTLPEAEPTQRFTGTETILVVEDEDEVRAFLRRALQRSGYTVLEARNAGEALLLCEQHAGAIELLLTDVVMPRMTGPELAARLRPMRPAMRVVYVSGYSEDRIDEPHDAFVAKPMSVDALLQSVRAVLDRRGAIE